MRHILIGLSLVGGMILIQTACAPAPGGGGSNSVPLNRVAKKVSPGANQDDKSASASGCADQIVSEGKKIPDNKPLKDEDLQKESLVLVHADQHVEMVQEVEPDKGATVRVKLAAKASVDDKGKVNEIKPSLLCKEFVNFKGESASIETFAKPAQILKGKVDTEFSFSMDLLNKKEANEQVKTKVEPPKVNTTATTITDLNERPGTQTTVKDETQCQNSKETYQLADQTIEILTCETVRDQGVATRIKTRAIYQLQPSI